MSSYWLADPADLVTLAIVKLPDQDTELRWQAAILHQTLRDLSAWPVSHPIHDWWQCGALKLDAVIDLQRNLVSGLERKRPQDLRREARVLARADHVFGGFPGQWMNILTTGQP
ncbi:hypothetical protein AU188_14615 [Mycobacterium sp. IS-3022]|nr:hypothetical protein AU188_14615 [Mycobacterium sp. IS-3022]